MKNTYKNSLYLLVENKLGVLERVLGVFSFRGHKLTNLICMQSKNPDLVDVKITIECTDQDLEKLVKILHNQINVLEIHLLIEDKDKKPACVAMAS